MSDDELFARMSPEDQARMLHTEGLLARIAELEAALRESDHTTKPLSAAEERLVAEVTALRARAETAEVTAHAATDLLTASRARAAELEAENERLRRGLWQIAKCRNPNPCATCTGIARTIVDVDVTSSRPSASRDTEKPKPSS